MNYFENITDQDYIFATMLLVANKMDTLLERALSKYNITAKQWFMLIVTVNAFNEAPTIKEIAKVMGSSHQNIKQLALKLEAKGMVVLEKDKKDLRATKVTLTKECFQLFKKLEKEGISFMNKFYKEINNTEMKNTRMFISKIMDNLKNIEEEQ
ncbi:MAG: transcriptional regulator [Fusobacteria bacterium]|nr:MAG: transcriptional regulator [Fusobacteriota bacterium]KAF0228560.1 MAG: transcriptional [Fusobacteriota bacterium]